MAYLNTQTNAYPVSEAEIRAEFSQTSFGIPFVAPEPYVWVFPAPRPGHNALTQYVREIPPALTQLGHYEQRWEVLHFSAEQLAASLAALKSNAVVAIDREVDAIYAAALGNRGQEYTDAESQARSFAATGFVEPAPHPVDAWAKAKGWDSKRAAEDIIDAAEQLRAAMHSIRAARLLQKELIKSASELAQVRQSMSVWAQFASSIRQQLGLELSRG